MLRSLLMRGKYFIIAAVGVPSAYFAQNYYNNYSLNKITKLQDSIQEKIKTVGENDHGIADLYKDMAKIYKYQENYEDAIAHFRKALGIYETFGEAASKPLEETYRELSECLSAIEKLDESLLAMEKSLEWKFKRFDPKDIDSLFEFENIAKKYEEKGMYQESIDCYIQILPIIDSFVLEEGQSSSIPVNKIKLLQVDILQNLGRLYFINSEKEYNKGGLLKAMDYFEEAIQRFKNIQDVDQSPAAYAYYNMGKTSHLLKKMDQAISYCKQSIKIFEEAGQTQNSAYAHCCALIGYDYMYQGRADNALPHLEKSIKIYESIQKDLENGSKLSEKQVQDMKQQYAQTLINLGVVHLRKKNLNHAIELTKKGVALFEKIKGEDDIDTLGVKFNLVVTLLEAGDKKQAWDNLSEVYSKSKSKFGESHPLTTNAFQLINVFANFH